MNSLVWAPLLLSVLLPATSPPGVPRLRAPAALAAKERAQTKDAGSDGQACTVGVAYGEGESSPDAPGLLQVFSTTTTRLRAASTLNGVDAFLSAGRGGASIRFDDLLCLGAAFGPIADVGRVSHEGVDRMALTAGGFAQDLCGPAEILALTRKGEHYVVVRHALKAAAPAYACESTEPASELECQKRDTCARAFLQDQQNAAAIRARLRDAVSSLRFKN